MNSELKARVARYEAAYKAELANAKNLFRDLERALMRIETLEQRVDNVAEDVERWLSDKSWDILISQHDADMARVNNLSTNVEDLELEVESVVNEITI